MNPNVLTETKVPQIPSTQGVQDPVARMILEALIERLSVREGIIGDPLDQNVRFRDLYTNGMLQLGIDRTPYVRLPKKGVAFLPLPRPQDVATDFTPPPAVTGLVASGALANIILQFDVARYSNHSYTEIWRSAVDDIGTAVLAGTTDSSLYADNIGQTAETRYYWARHVSSAGIAGPFNAVAGTDATTGEVENANIAAGAVTADKITVAELAAISAVMGDLTSGTITLNSTGHIKSGATAFETGAGFWLGRDSGATKFFVGDSSGYYISWDGSVLTVHGQVDAADIVASDLSAISADLGTITAGRAQNAGNTNFIDFDATGTSSFLKVGSAIDIKADGSATFSGIVLSRNLVAASDTDTALVGTYPLTDADGWTKLGEVDVDTGYETNAWEATDKAYVGAAGVAAAGGSSIFVSGTGTPAGDIADWAAKITEIYTKVHWSAPATIHLKIELWAQVFDDTGWTASSIEFTSGIDWVLYEVT